MSLARMKASLLRVCDRRGAVKWSDFESYNRRGVMSPSAREHARRARAALAELVSDGVLVEKHPGAGLEWRRRAP